MAIVSENATELKEIDFSKRSSLHASIVWGLAAFFYLYEIMLLVSPSVMLDDLTVAFKASAEQLGNLAAFYYYAYALMQIPVGLLVDRFGPRLLLALAALLCSVGCFIFGFAPTLLIAEMGRFVMGIGGSFAVVGCLKLASIWFPINRFAFLTGLMVAVGMMGGVFGQAPVAELVEIFGWRKTLYLGGIAGGILSIIIWFVVKDTPWKKSETSIKHVTQKRNLSVFSSLYAVMAIPQVWVASIYAGLMFVPTTGFGQLWGVPYFIERFSLPKDEAGYMVSMIFFGWAVGGPLYGWISDKIQRRKFPMGFAAITSLIVMLAIMYIDMSPFHMKICVFLLGAFSSGFVLAFSLVREINAPILTGTAIGFVNTINNASGALAQPVVGKLLDAQWQGQILTDGSPIYTVAMYNNAFLFLPVCLLLSFIMLPLIRETFCRPLFTRVKSK